MRKELSILEDIFVIVCCGILDWWKGGDLIVFLLVILKKKLFLEKKFVCIWVGNWDS